MSLFGQILPPVQLRFNSAQRGALHASALAGMKRFGPYDLSLFPQRWLTCGLIYPASAQRMRDALVNGFQQILTQSFADLDREIRIVRHVRHAVVVGDLAVQKVAHVEIAG